MVPPVRPRISAAWRRTFSGFSPSSGAEEPVLSLDASGELQIWFQNNNRWGCNAYDSAFGANYHFAIAN